MRSQRLTRISVFVFACAIGFTLAQEQILTNPTKRDYKDELVRLPLPAPGPAGSFIVKEDGAEIAYQVERIDGKDWIWICSNFAPTSAHKYENFPGAPRKTNPKIRMGRGAEFVELDNGLIALKLPVSALQIAPGPINQIKLADKWIGASTWHTQFPLKKFSSEIIGDGTLFAKIRMRYEFDGMAGLDANIPAFAEIDVTLGPGWSHAEIFERHEMGRFDYWEMELSKGWSPNHGESKPFSGGAGSGLVMGKVDPNRALMPGGLPFQQDDLYINLLPRWNQHYKDGWFFAATDGVNHAGAAVVSASQWIWPHNNSIQVLMKPSGDYAGLRCGTWKGQRLWWLFAPDLKPASIDYVTRHAWERLDKLNREFILDWPGATKGSFGGMNFYDSSQMNPSSGGIRGGGRNAIANAGKGGGDLSTLSRVQVMLHPDAYGSYLNYWSPGNPNFFTDFMKMPIALTAQLKAHPRFDELRKLAEAKFKEDMEHAITLPGGAGQECPGYVSYALKNWGELAEVCKKHLGFDPTTWERYKAAQYFLKRISQPDGTVRRELPMGDTHPDKAGGPKKVDVPADEAVKFTTEELPGFGVIFYNRSGTPAETYLAFKSGPNRGHYHGDQLSFHWCANAAPVAVDHHSSYHPRAGQEHMHNRVAFSTDKLPYANMDGYERLIAFKTSAVADVAVGQVESERLRACEKLPPEIWDQRYPQHAFAKPLIYRRTMLFIKNGAQDYFVIRDQFWASESLNATFCLHVLTGKMERHDQRIEFGNATLFCATPAQFQFDALPWSHDNGGLESTQGARLTISGDHGEFITVLYPGNAPATLSAIDGGVQVGEDRVVFAADSSIVVQRAGKEVLRLSSNEITLNRSQGDIGLFVPDTGYPFGEVPDWLIRQRTKH